MVDSKDPVYDSTKFLELSMIPSTIVPIPNPMHVVLPSFNQEKIFMYKK